jgi:AraC-like DNA-binding protein
MIEDLRKIVDRHCTGKPFESPISGLKLHRADTPVARIMTSYSPALCVIAQGVKQVMVGNRIFQYDPMNYLVVTVPLPVTSRIVQASPKHPMLALTIDLNPARISEVMLDLPADTTRSDHPAALAVSPISDELLDAVTRFVSILDHPEDVAVLAPLFEREIFYRLLRGKHASLLRQVVTGGSHLSQIARATDWIRTHYADRISIDALASLADMSITSFHRHFKAITAMSPLQYRTQMRLQEARRLMLERDYRKMFGMPPGADAARLRRSDPVARPAV